MDFENKAPDWEAQGVEPSEGMKTNGFQAGQKPPASHFNWFWTLVSKGIAELQTKLKGHAESTSNPHGITAAQIGAIPETRTVNGKALSSDITLTPSDIGVDESGAAGEVQGNLDTHTADTRNPHSVTKSQVGLGNVDNTSDANKPISAAAQTALNGKANTNHSHAQSEIMGLTTALSGKADLENGKVPESQLPALGVALGETSETAYRGDRGKEAYDHSQNADVHVTAAQKAKWNEKADLVDGKANTDLSNVDNSILAEKVTQAGAGTPVVNATSTDGVTYTATIDGMTELTVGKHFIIIPNTASTSATPKLNVNGFGEQSLRQGLSTSTADTVEGSSTNWLSANKPVEVMWDGLFFRANITRQSANNLYGTLPIEKGGTGYTSIADTTHITARYRASALVSAETTPTINGVVNWMYE